MPAPTHAGPAADAEQERRRAAAVSVLCRLADLADEGPQLEARRREAASFEPAAALVGLYLDLLGETAPDWPPESVYSGVRALCAALAAEKRGEEAFRLLEGLSRLERSGSGGDPERARRLKAALAEAVAAAKEALR